MTAAFHEAIAQEVVWKNDEIRRFAVNLVRRALAQGGHFTTDIVPDTERGSGPGIAGSVIELLKNANVIQPVGYTAPNGTWYALRCKSTRPDRKSAWLSVYQLTSAGMAESFLARHGAAPGPLKQQDLIVA
jgi:hypothetical protein